MRPLRKCYALRPKYTVSPTSGMSTSKLTITNLPLSISTGKVLPPFVVSSQCLHRELRAKPHRRTGSTEVEARTASGPEETLRAAEAEGVRQHWFRQPQA
jgi:hypothetical protein